MSAKNQVICAQLYMQDYSRPMVDFLVLNFGILIAKRLFNGNSISSKLSSLHAVNKMGQKVKKFNFRFFRKIQQMINICGNKSLF